jgi:tRNA pseudouridine32 synthase / 23S rRNA pseudouridine746 synthase
MVETQDCFFTRFETTIETFSVPDQFKLTIEPHPLCLLAVTELQNYLQTQTEWQHNFGLASDVSGKIIGKMFGVLVVANENNEIGYLAAFSGKMAGMNTFDRFVPPIFDGLTEAGIVNAGMQELSRINIEIERLTLQRRDDNQEQIKVLKKSRSRHSNNLLNKSGDSKSLIAIFQEAGYKNPPSGAGECAGPKLLQHAFHKKYQPLAMAEFWWGQSPKSDQWKHGEFYPSCKEKCEPILRYLLD